MKKIELLAPAGGYEQFIAAVENGADAVYLGGNAFNARYSAANFSEDELKKVIEYAHIRDVKVYITLNTLVNDSEIIEAAEFAKRMHLAGADAFIIQDLGLAYLLKNSIPDINLHLSTQATIYSHEGIEALCNLNFSRIVLARELSLNEIKNICNKTDKEIEVFVHGAMCVSYSGQCRFSSLIGERSGNRGKCAQPCRLSYSLIKDNKELISNYCMSPKDLCGLYDIPELIKSGVSSLKIEGRMKSSEYVACVTQIYRKYIDMAYQYKEYVIDENDIKNLKQIFNRGNFTSGYFHEKQGKNFISRERSKHWGTFLGNVIEYNKNRKFIKLKLNQDIDMGDGIEVLNGELSGNIVTYIEKAGQQIKKAVSGETVLIGDISGNILKGQEIYKISSKLLNNKLKESFNGKFYKKIPIKAELKVKKGQKIELTFKDARQNLIKTTSEYIVQTAINKPFNEEMAKKSLEKLGDTPFFISEYDMEIEENCLIPVSVINELRRNAAAELCNARQNTNINNQIKPWINVSHKQSIRQSKISVYLYNTNNLDGLELADRVYLPAYGLDELDLSKLKGKEIVLYMPPITKGENINIPDTQDYNGVLVANSEHIKIFREKVNNIYGDYSLNVFNSYTCEAMKELGLKGINLSFELNFEQIKDINTDLELEVTVYGRLPLMISEHCPIGSEIGGRLNCGLCKKADYYLEDRTGANFPIITDTKVCRSMLLNSRELFVAEAVEILKGKVDYFRAYFLNESTNERRDILTKLKAGKKIDCAGCTAGHFYRGV